MWLHLRHPILLALVGFIVVLVPSLVALALAYDEARDRYFDPTLPAVPKHGEMGSIARRLAPAGSQWKVVRTLHVPSPPPRSGVVRVDLVQDEAGEARLLAIVRHDISRETCTNLLVAVLISLDDRRILAVQPLERWELHGEPLDPTPFLSQLVDRSTSQFVEIIGEIDGITGATLTVEALLHEMKALDAWVRLTDSVHKGRPRL